jgi:Subtilase family
VTQETYWYSGLNPRLAEKAEAEAEIIAEAFRHRDITIGDHHYGSLEICGYPDREEEAKDHDVKPDGIAYMYVKDHILVREQYLVGVDGPTEPKEPSWFQRASKQRGVLDILLANHVEVAKVTRIVEDTLLLQLNPGDCRVVPDLLKIIDDELGAGIATPDHVLTASQMLTPCAATEPQPVHLTGPHPERCPDGGARVRIFVADTGLVEGWANTFPWLDGVTGDIDLRGPLGAQDPNNPIESYGGHGTFVAGVLRCMAPDAQVHVGNFFPTAGSAPESELVPMLNEAFGFGFEILHLTASCMTRNNIPPLALEGWLERLRPYKGVVCVAPAGNNHTRRPSWPGAFPDVLSVGALSTDLDERAYFSNYGGWVDVYAPGQDLINAFGIGTYTCKIPPNAQQERKFSGLALWSGTSFSAPIVTGLIAARMVRCGESARHAADALLARARAQTVLGVGPVLLPGCGDDDECGCRRDGGCRCEDGCRCDGRRGGDCGCGTRRGRGGGCAGCGCSGGRLA